MNIDLLVIDDNAAWLKIMQVLLKDRLGERLAPKYFNDVNKCLSAITDNPTIIVVDYHLENITGDIFLKKALEKNELIHAIFMSSAVSVPILLGIINLGWGFFFVPKDDTDFTERIVRKVNRAEANLRKKVAAIIKRNEKDEQLKASAIEALKVLGNG